MNDHPVNGHSLTGHLSDDRRSEERPTAERRKSARHRTLKGGSISINHGGRIDCRVRNLSPAGALLEVTSQIGIPDDFVLVIDADRFKQPCHVIWRTATRMGVEFRA